MENDILNNLETNYNYLDTKFSEDYPAGDEKSAAAAKSLPARTLLEISAKKNYVIYSFLSILILLLYFRPNIVMKKITKNGTVVKKISFLKLLIITIILGSAVSFALIYFTK
jgi:hypothetical protein